MNDNASTRRIQALVAVRCTNVEETNHRDTPFQAEHRHTKVKLPHLTILFFSQEV